MTEGTTCPKCNADLTQPDAQAMGRCRKCGWDLSLPDREAKRKPAPDSRKYQGPGRKR